LYLQIFCVHGGIPLPSQGGGLVSSIDNIPSVLFDPEKQSNMAWELMWGDPLRYLPILKNKGKQTAIPSAALMKQTIAGAVQC